jgi:hypothetical protein
MRQLQFAGAVVEEAAIKRKNCELAGRLLWQAEHDATSCRSEAQAWPPF